jgi:hypothetical protein
MQKKECNEEYMKVKKRRKGVTGKKDQDRGKYREGKGDRKKKE